MARYFDPDDDDSRAMIPPDIARDESFPSLAAVVEADVIGQYVVVDRVPGYRGDLVGGDSGFLTDWGLAAVPPGGVYLRGYATDPAQADPGLRRALRREIAEVVRWRWSQHRKAAGVTSTTKGDPATSESYDPSVDRPFPPHFGAFLRAYDARPVDWAP